MDRDMCERLKPCSADRAQKQDAVQRALTASRAQTLAGTSRPRSCRGATGCFCRFLARASLWGLVATAMLGCGCDRREGADGPKEFAQVDVRGDVACVAFSPGGKWLATAVASA